MGRTLLTLKPESRPSHSTSIHEPFGLSGLGTVL